MELCKIMLKLVFAFVLTGLSLTENADSLKKKNNVCGIVDPCTCIFPDGDGVNLQNIGIVESDCFKSVVILFHPCFDTSFLKPFTNETTYVNECKEGTSLCLVDLTNGDHINIGKSLSTIFLTIPGTRQINLEFHNGDWSANMYLECTTTANTTLSIESLDVINYKTTLKLMSPEACLKKNILSITTETDSTVSLVSVIFAAIIIVIVIYMMIATLINVIHGARGVDIIPHYHFFSNFILLVRDGFQFCLNGCRSSSSYDQI